jgi:nucleoside-diphosphate-sugar epimerase
MTVNNQQSRKLFCFGLGYTAEVFARRLMATGWRVAGTCREPDRAEALRETGMEIHLFDRDQPLAEAGEILADVDCLLSSVPPDSDGDAVLDLHGDDIAAAGARLAWIGYLSTTGVYGTRDGGWVDEQSERRPGAERSRRRVAAEDRWQALGAHLFRLAGIYGPGRSVFDQIKAGRARRVHRPEQVFSRIHVEDVATILQASSDRPQAGAAYNVCDNEPAPPADVISHACELLGIEPPPLVPFEEAELSAMALTFWADNKRVRNDRLKQDLAVELKYPDYRSGLAAILKEA